MTAFVRILVLSTFAVVGCYSALPKNASTPTGEKQPGEKPLGKKPPDKKPPDTKPPDTPDTKPPLHEGIHMDGDARDPEPTARDLDDRPSKPRDQLAMRAAAIRLKPAQRATYSVGYRPDPSLAVPGLATALKDRSIGAQVKAFDQNRATKGVQHVQHGGEIVALALALQLQKSGWVVAMVDKAMLRAGISKPSGNPRALALRFLVTGAISFSVGSNARVAGTITFTAHSGKVRVTAEAVSALPKTGHRSRRYSVAATSALQSFVRKIVSDPNLSKKLIAYVKSHKAR